ncbi:MAG: hypothetical protein JWO60_3031 [Frankiales bacterium]|jgi:hypothetical protein|nr:hypothetical protein [Frankiales bacterium]
MAEYEYRRVPIPADADRHKTKELLVLHAEFGDWELSRHRIWAGGRREITVRRRVRSEPMPPFMT